MHKEGSNTQPRAGRDRLVAVGLLTLAASLSAYAQTASTPSTAASSEATAASGSTDQNVVVLNQFNVSGSYAGSLEAAAQEKQNSQAIVEVIAPEDIGKLPDVSIADALTRLTGITSQRVNGRDQQITIRGFSSDFSTGTLDGVEQATTNDNRAVEYDQYPSELVGGVQVYKTGQADLVGGLAGTVDLETTSPLLGDHRVVALSGYYNWNQFKQLTPGVKKAGESYTLSYIDQFLNGTEGVYLGYAHAENPYQGENWSSWGFPTADAKGDLVLGGMRVFDQSELLTRDSVIAVIESRPNDWIHSKIDLFYSKFDDNQLLGGMQVPMAEWSGAQLSPGYTVTGGLVTNYSLTNVNPVLEELVTRWKDHLDSAIWNLDLGEKTEWPVKIQTGYSTAKRKQEVLETYAGLGFNNTETNPATLTVNEPAGPNPPSITSTVNFAQANLFTITDPQGWGTGTLPTTGQEGYLKYFAEEDVVDSFKASTTHALNLGIVKDVQIGASYSERFKSAAQNPTGYLVNADGKPQDPLPALLGTTDLSGMLGGGIHTIAWNANNLLSSGALKLLQNPNPGTFVGDDYKVWEKITRPYVKFDLKGKLFGIPYDGNIGAVSDLTTQRSSGQSAGGSGSYVFPVSASSTYADLLPTLNLILKPTDQDAIRLFVGRQEQRPRMYDMRASRDFGYNSTYATSTSISPWSGSSGNPNLKPWIANSVDIDLEHYFAHGNGYVSITGFEKKLLSYIYQQSTLTSFAGYPYTSVTAPLLTQGYTNTPINGQGGNVSGLEATIEVTSALLTNNTIKGFGIVLNGLYVDSTIQPWGPTQPTAPLPDLSKKSGNATFYYEAHGFSGRVSVHYQSETREYIQNLGVPTPSNFGTPGDGYSTEIPYHQIDAQLSYDFKHGMLKGLGIYLEGRNLNNAALIQYNNNDPRQLGNWQKYGASYRSGVTYKF